MRVLVVEDEPKMAALIQEMLEREGYRVTSTGDGLDGFSLAVEGHFGVIVLDRMLPTLDGTEVIRRLRQRGIATPVLMLTALADTPDIVTGLDCGVDDYLTKPFESSELFARLRALARRPAVVQNSTLTFADIELDTVTHEVRVGGAPVRLTETEFQILECLIREPSRLHHRDALISAVWGLGYKVDNNTLDAFMKQLRAKIDANPGRKLIRTVRGYGYRLSSEQA